MKTMIIKVITKVMAIIVPIVKTHQSVETMLIMITFAVIMILLLIIIVAITLILV